MDEPRAWQIIGANLDRLVGVMVTLTGASRVDVFCDSTGKDVSFGSPSGTANIKLCPITAPDLNDNYGIHQSGDGFVNDDGETISKEQLPSYLVQYIQGAKDGGAEWGWEFKLNG